MALSAESASCARTTVNSRCAATVVDLVFGSHTQLRGIAAVYASADAGSKFAQDLVAAWNKVTNLDRYDLARDQ